MSATMNQEVESLRAALLDLSSRLVARARSTGDSAEMAMLTCAASSALEAVSAADHVAVLRAKYIRDGGR